MEWDLKAATQQERDRATRVRELRDSRTIRALLQPHRAYAAYAIGQLSPSLFPQVRCFYAEHADGDGLALFSGGGLGDALFTQGTTAAVEAILRLHRGPRQTFVTCAPDHIEVLRRYYRVNHEQDMMRMAVTQPRFAPAPLPPGVTMRRLQGLDARTVNRLYNTEGAPTFYSPSHIEHGYYHGLFVNGRMVAVAGTHVVSPEEGVAVVGNVFTHPRYRGYGYGTAVTGATTAELLAHCRDVVLTVDPRNTPAVRAYRRLGYVEACRLVEAPVTRKGLIGVSAALRRLAASWRGRSQGVELVR